AREPLGTPVLPYTTLFRSAGRPAHRHRGRGQSRVDRAARRKGRRRRARDCAGAAGGIVRIARALAASLLAAAFTSCAPPGEQPLLSQFFAASRLRDRTALRDIASVSFEPNVQGVVTSFEVTHVAPV